MNKIIRILSIAAFVAALVGCEKDPLNKQPQSSLAPEEFFSQVSGLEAFSNNFYTTFPTVFAENADVYAMATMPEEISGRVQVPSTGGGWSWGTLRNINTLLGYLHCCDNQDAVKYYDALSRFFRAYFYFDKVKQFGDVPWYDKELGSADADLYKARDSREYVMQKMVEDIDIAIANLPSERNVYRITKWTALALKSRFCLFEGTFRKYHNITSYENDADYYLELAADASYKFITSSGYSIAKDAGDPEKNYRKLFSTMNATTTEVILAKDFNAALDLVHNVGGAFNTATNGRYGMTRKVVAAYLMKDGTRFTAKAGGVGGLVGVAVNLVMKRCSFSGDIVNSGRRMGGLVGYHNCQEEGNYLRIEDSWSAGSITGQQNIGGIVGQTQYNNGTNGFNTTASVIRHCYSTMSVTANQNAGGIAGGCSYGGTYATTELAINKDMVIGNIAWNEKVESKTTTTGNYSSSAVVGFCNIYQYFVDCYRKPNFPLTCPVTDSNPITVLDQDNTSPVLTLYTGTVADPSCPYAYQHAYPYHGKEAPAGATVSSLAKQLKWDETVWDLSGDLPALK